MGEFQDFPTLFLENIQLAKIGTTGKNISEADVASHISGIAIGIDYTATDVLKAKAG